MKKSLQVLHLASFSGNIGDNANHIGTRQAFADNLDFDFHYTPLEMREFFWGQRHFNDELIRYINKFDLLLIGGGNYLELWVEKSRTGCSIDLPPELLAHIAPPILFYGLGVDSGQGVPEANRIKFQHFLDYILDSPRCFLTVRNDGAMATLREFFADSALDKVWSVPDGGFFFQPADQPNSLLQASSETLAVNIAGDMLERRFPGGELLDDEQFLTDLSGVFTDWLMQSKQRQLVLVPHIFRDIPLAARLIDKLPDSLRRRQLLVAAYATGDVACSQAFDYYRQASVCLGVRFHANVCPLGMGKPVIGLSCYPQIDHLYQEIGRAEQCVAVNRPNFAGKLAAAIDQPPQALDTIVLQKQMISAHKTINNWLRGLF